MCNREAFLRVCVGEAVNRFTHPSHAMNVPLRYPQARSVFVSPSLASLAYIYMYVMLSVEFALDKMVCILLYGQC